MICVNAVLIGIASTNRGIERNVGVAELFVIIANGG